MNDFNEKSEPSSPNNHHFSIHLSYFCLHQRISEFIKEFSHFSYLTIGRWPFSLIYSKKLSPSLPWMSKPRKWPIIWSFSMLVSGFLMKMLIKSGKINFLKREQCTWDHWQTFLEIIRKNMRFKIRIRHGWMRLIFCYNCLKQFRRMATCWTV